MRSAILDLFPTPLPSLHHFVVAAVSAVTLTFLPSHCHACLVCAVLPIVFVEKIRQILPAAALTGRHFLSFCLISSSGKQGDFLG